MSILLTVTIGTTLVLLTVILHHEALRVLTHHLLPRSINSHRWNVSLIVLVLMLAHVLEIMLYAVGMFLASELWLLGNLAGEDIEIATYAYFSFACYTSLGIGDIVPVGGLRLLSGIEALNGLMLIGWSASFLLIEMRERWS